MLNDLKKFTTQQQQQQFIHHQQMTTTKNCNKIVNNLFFEYYYNEHSHIIKIPSPSSSLPSTPLSLQSSKSIVSSSSSSTTTASTTSSESLNENTHNQQQQQQQQDQPMYINSAYCDTAYSNEEYCSLDDIDVLKPISINCNFYYNRLNKQQQAHQSHTPGLLKISHSTTSEQQQRKQCSLSVSTSSPSSCSFISSSSSSSIALVSPPAIKLTNLNATPDTSNSSSATMIIRKSPEVYASGTYNARQAENNISYVQTLSPPPSVNAKTNLNYIFSNFDHQQQQQHPQYTRRSMPGNNYENDFMVLHNTNNNKRKINSLSPIMTSSRADLHTIASSQPQTQTQIQRTPKQQLNFNSAASTVKFQTPKLKSILIPNNQQQQQNRLSSACSNTSTPVFHKKFVSFKLLDSSNDTFQCGAGSTDHEIDIDDDINLTLQNAFSNDTYGFCLPPPQSQSTHSHHSQIYDSNSKELNKFIEENKLRVERLRCKRIQASAVAVTKFNQHHHHQQHTGSPMVWMV